MDTEARVKQLERELGEAKEEGELARTELAELKKHLKEIEDNSENTNKFLHAEISRVSISLFEKLTVDKCSILFYIDFDEFDFEKLQITRQKAELRCEFLSLQRDYKRLKEDKVITFGLSRFSGISEEENTPII